MIGFSIVMWFTSFVTFMVAASLLRGNTAAIHGKVFEATKDQTGYGKQLGKLCVLLCFGLFISGMVAFFVKGSMAIVYALTILLVTIFISAIWFFSIQIKYKN